jgi:uncharacterized circularly permuted ATP-grasp superfamily protein
VITQRSPLAAYDPTAFWDEMFSAPGVVRPHYAALARRLETLSAQEVTRRQRAADLSFQARGITFAVNQDPSGLEKIMPFDLVPRIILPEEWEHIERGLEQRVRALNLFLHDVYHEQKILGSGLIPPELVLGSRGYRREVRSVEPPLGVYTHVVGSDLVRDHRGEYPIRPVEGYPQDLLSVLREVAPAIADAATVVLLTPGVHNSAFFEHAFLAKAMGIEMVQGSDLFVDDATVYMRTTSGRRRVDVIYRRVDDDFIDPLAFRRDSFLGVPGLLATYRMGRVSVANALGTGVADDKAIYSYVPTIIKYYLGEDEILPNVKTYVAADPSERAYILEHIAELVVKSVNASGGYGMLIGPHAPKADREEYRRRIEADPRGYIAQPTLALSRHPSWSEGSLEGRHVDLRPYVLFGKEIRVTPGGLTRVALRAGSLVVNSSQGGGAKDTWVLG